MATHWITASTALEILGGNPARSVERVALCTRAFEGLVATKARLVTMDKKRAENVRIPTSFWWASGHEALKQNWQVGDFSTWIEQSSHCQVFGVQFDLDGVREMLPAAKAALVARSLSVAGDSEWLTAKASRAFMYNQVGANPVVAGEQLIEQCRLGFVAARAVQMQQTDRDNPGVGCDEAREWDIPVWFWENLTRQGTSRQDWERGLFTGKGRGPVGGLCEVVLSGVHFAISSLLALLPPAENVKTGAGSETQNGRPPKPFWDELLSAIWGQIYRGELMPKRQSDIQNAMLDWASAKGHLLSETTAKERARPVFAEYSREGGNP